MSDASVRTLERAALSSGAPSDVAAWHLAALRDAGLTLDLGFASYLRSAEAVAAGRAIGHDDVRVIDDAMVETPDGLATWGRGLEGRRKGASFRALAALLRFVAGRRPEPAWLALAVDDLERWIVSADPQLLAAIAARTPPPGPADPQQLAALATRTRLPAPVAEDAVERWALEALQWTRRSDPRRAVRPALERALLGATAWAPPVVVCDAICAELRPWCLGAVDPLVERHGPADLAGR